MSNQSADLQLLIQSYHPLVVVETMEEGRVDSLLRSIGEGLGFPLFTWSATEGLRRDVDGVSLNRATMDARGGLQYIQQLGIEAIFHLKDMDPFLKDAEVARQFRDVASQFNSSRSCMVLSGHSVELPSEIAAVAVHFELAFPTLAEIAEVVDQTIGSLQQRDQLNSGVSPEVREQLIRSFSGMTLDQVQQSVARAALDDGVVNIDDCWKILQNKADQIKEDSVLEYFPVQSDLTTLGGFQNMKRWLDRASLGFSEEARAMNLQPPKGLLLTGVQGCGKSLAAKMIAQRWQVPLLKLDAGRLYNKYIGESERNFRKATKLAESLAPAVLWIDEIEKAFGGGGGSEDGGTSLRLLGSFLTWLQEKSASVFVVGTSNDLFSLPPEFLRKGRFDEIFFIDLPNSGERLEILRIHLIKRKQTPEQFDLNALVAACEGYSGAEIEQAVIASLYEALYQRQPLTTEMLLREVQSTVPLSVSRAEDIRRLREVAGERFVRASD
ncbi:AAA family ATPase [Verrucomicrobiales bacterium]|nr:AAA family ATPase [Verrucomicrobiales bacterium]